MADYVHLSNIIQGEIIRIRERRPLEHQEEDLNAMIAFLTDQRQSIIITKLKVIEEISAQPC